MWPRRFNIGPWIEPVSGLMVMKIAERESKVLLKIGQGGGRHPYAQKTAWDKDFDVDKGAARL